MSVVVYEKPKAPLKGIVRLPSSKSIAHRAILAATLTRGTCRINGIYANKDVEATLRAVKALGISAEYRPHEKTLDLSPAVNINREREIDCGESGATLRFIIPIFAALGLEACFVGSGRLPRRPLSIYQELLSSHGVRVRTEGGLPFEISGQLRSGVFELPGNVSSQFITGLMLALPLLNGNSSIILTSPLESSGYVNMTLQTLSDFGIVTNKNKTGWTIPGGQCYQPVNYNVEGDWSHAAFFLSHAAISPGGSIKLQGLREHSAQGDRACVSIYRQFGLEILSTADSVTACNNNAEKSYHGLRAVEIDAAQIPDLVPAAAVCAAFAQGQTRIYNAGRLRFKESDRLEAMANAINALGGKAKLSEDEIWIEGVESLKGGNALGVNDHRVVMALSAAGLGSDGPVRVTDAESICKSYPDFFTDYIGLGGIADVIDMG